MNGLEEKNEIKSYEVEADNDSEGAQESFVEKRLLMKKLLMNKKLMTISLPFLIFKDQKKLEKDQKKIIMSVFYYRLDKRAFFPCFKYV